MLVETTLSLVPCLNNCGPYGQCLLLRRHGYLYAGCSCKAGEGQPRASGHSCPLLLSPVPSFRSPAHCPG